MNKVFRKSLLAVFAGVLSFGLVSCSDDENLSSPEPGALTADEQEIKAFAEQYLDATLYPTYRMLADSTAILADQLTAMRDKVLNGGTVTQDEIDAACTVFLHARANYETSEAFLFGAATDFGIDPHIDTWPLDLDMLKTALTNNSQIEAMAGENGDEYAGVNLGPALLGFHGIEYILFRDGQNRTASSLNSPDADLNNLTAREELIYAAAVAGDLRNKCFQMEVAWNVDAPADHIAKVEALEWPYQMTNGLSYGENMMLAGQAGSTYNSWRRVSDAIILSGCINICDEVGEVKMGTPHGGVEGVAQDPNYIESPYSWNSITDFYDNLCSIENSIMGGRPELRDETKSIYAYVNKRNAELAAQLRADIDDAKAKIRAMKYPFVHNYTDASVAEAMEACMKLSDTLGEVNTYILSH